MKNLSKGFIYSVAIIIGSGLALLLIINQSSEAAPLFDGIDSESLGAGAGTGLEAAIGTAESVSLSSPFKFESITDFILNIPQILSCFAGITGLVFFAVNAIKYLAGAGDEAKTTEAKQGLLYSAIGVGLAALTFTIISLAKNLLTR